MTTSTTIADVATKIAALSNPTLAAAGNLLTGYTAYGKGFTKYTGTMTNNGAVSGSISTSGGTYTIPVGYHNGSGKVTGPTLAALIGTNVTLASAANLLTGYTAYGKNGTKYTGSMTNNGAVTKTFTPSSSSQSYTIPKGYHNGSGKVTVNAASGVTVNNIVLLLEYAGKGVDTVGDFVQIYLTITQGSNTIFAKTYLPLRPDSLKEAAGYSSQTKTIKVNSSTGVASVS